MNRTGRRSPRTTVVQEAPDAITTLAEERFEDFFRREYRPVVAMAHVLTGNFSLAEDLAQEAFVAVARDWTRVATLDNPRAWVRRIVSNHVVSYRRRAAREARAVSRHGADPPVVAPLPADADHFWARVRDLPARQSQVIALCYLGEFSAAQIGQILRCSEATVRVHLHRARRTLAAQLDLDLGDERDD
jgi:RNA polymerase sigma-70 factor (ECF subfamily)